MTHKVIIDGTVYVPQFQKPKAKLPLSGCFRSAREVTGWPLEEAASRAGISKTYLWELETGAAKRPSFQVVCSLAEIYQIELDWLASSLDAKPSKDES